MYKKKNGKRDDAETHKASCVHARYACLVWDMFSFKDDSSKMTQEILDEKRHDTKH